MKTNFPTVFRLFFTIALFFAAVPAQTSTLKNYKKNCEPVTGQIPAPSELISGRTLDVVDFSGEGTYEIFPSAGWKFTGPTRQITVAAGQKIIGSGSAVFGTTSGTSQVSVSLCYQKKGESQVFSMSGDNHLIADVDALQRTFAVTAAALLPDGAYSVGYCVVNRGKQVIGNNNYVNGWVIVVR